MYFDLENMTFSPILAGQIDPVLFFATSFVSFICLINMKHTGMSTMLEHGTSIRWWCIKVIKEDFLNNKKSFRWHLGDYEKHNFFPFEGL